MFPCLRFPFILFVVLFFIYGNEIQFQKKRMLLSYSPLFSLVGLISKSKIKKLKPNQTKSPLLVLRFYKIEDNYVDSKRNVLTNLGQGSVWKYHMTYFVEN